MATRPSRGLFEGFEAYRSPTEDDYRRALTEGLVVADTNVFLNLYRYRQEARDDLLAILEGLSDRLWVPHQVVAEFWRNRDAVLRDPRGCGKVAADLSSHKDQASQAFRAWANRVSLPDVRRGELEQALTTGFYTVLAGVDDLRDEDSTKLGQDTNSDPVVIKLEAILKGRVGLPLEDADRDVAIAEGRRRAEAKEPPGYMDSAKGDDLAVGDYLVEVVPGSVEMQVAALPPC